MPDIFDNITLKKPQDIFDEIPSEEKESDIFDSIAPEDKLDISVKRPPKMFDPLPDESKAPTIREMMTSGRQDVLSIKGLDPEKKRFAEEGMAAARARPAPTGPQPTVVDRGGETFMEGPLPAFLLKEMAQQDEAVARRKRAVAGSESQRKMRARDFRIPAAITPELDIGSPSLTGLEKLMGIADPQDVAPKAIIEPAEIDRQGTIGAFDPTTGEKVSSFLRRLPERDPQEILHSGIGKVLRTPLKYAKGKLLGTPEIGWAFVKRAMGDNLSEEVKNMTLDQAMDWASRSNPSGFEKAVGNLAEFIGGVSTGGKIIDKLAGPTPKVAGVIGKAARQGIKFGTGKAGREISKAVSEGIDPGTDYGGGGKEAVLIDTTLGVGFSLAGSVIAKPGMAAIAKTKAGKAIIKASDKVIIELSKNFPAVMDTVRKDPEKYFTKQALRWHKQQGGKPLKQWSKNERVIFKHIVREGQRRILRASKLAGPPSDIITRKPAPPPPPAQITGTPTTQPTKPPVKPVSPAKQPTTPTEPPITPTKPKAVTEDVKGVEGEAEIEGIKRINPELFRVAQRAKTVDAFINKISKGKPETVSINALTDFYNRVKSLTPEQAKGVAEGEVEAPVWMPKEAKLLTGNRHDIKSKWEKGIISDEEAVRRSLLPNVKAKESLGGPGAEFHEQAYEAAYKEGVEELEKLRKKAGLPPNKQSELFRDKTGNIERLTIGDKITVDGKQGEIIPNMRQNALKVKFADGSEAKLSTLSDTKITKPSTKKVKKTKAEGVAEGKEKIKAPIVIASGQVFEGVTHGQALNKAKEAGLIVEDENVMGGITDTEGNELAVTGALDSFITTEGRIVNRFQAGQEFDITSAEKLIIKEGITKPKEKPTSLAELKKKPTPPKQQEGKAKKTKLGKIKPEDIKKGTKIEVVSPKTGKITQGKIIGKAGKGKVAIKLETGVGRRANIDELFEPASPEAVDKSNEILAAKQQEVETKKLESGAGAAAYGFTSLNPALARAQRLAKKDNADYYVQQQAGGKFGVRKTKPKKGYYTLVKPSGKATFIKQASLLADGSFDYGEHLKESNKFADKLEGFKNKLRETNVNVRALQDELFRAVKASGMSPAKVKAVLGLLRNIRPEQQIKTNIKSLLKAIVRASEYTEQENVRVMKRAYNKLLNSTKVKKVHGKPKGKGFPTTQERLEFIRYRRSQKVSREGTLAKISQNVEKWNRGEMTYSDMMEENSLLNLTGLIGASSRELVEMHKGLQKLVKDGKMLHDAQMAEFHEEVANIKTNFMHILTGGQGLKEGWRSDPTGAEKKPWWGNRLNRWSSSWDNIGDYLSRFDKTSKPYESAISQVFDTIHQAEHDESLGMRKYHAEVYNAFMDVFGVKTGRKMWRQMSRLQKNNVNLAVKVHPSGKFKNSFGQIVTGWGEKRKNRLNKEQIIKMYMNMQDPTLDETFRGGVTKEGKEYGMGWTDKMRQVVEDSLTETEKRWARKHLEIYRKYYPSVNKVYKEMYFVDLPFNKMYSPINRMVEQDLSEETLLFKEVVRHKSVTNPSLISRVKSVIPLRWTEADRTLMNHITRMEHFKAYAKPMRVLRSIFSDPEIKKAVNQYHGRKLLKRINLELDMFAKGGIDQMLINNWIDRLRRNFTVAALARPNIFLKQPGSGLAYLFEMKFRDFFLGSARFWLRPLRNNKLLKRLSPLYSDSLGSGHERDQKLVLRRSAAREIVARKNPKDNFMVHIKFGDFFGRGPGLYAKWRSVMKRKKLSPKAAMRVAERTTGRTQPGWQLSQLSAPQKGSSLWKAMTMFQTQPIRYYGAAIDNMRNLAYGRGSRLKSFTNLLMIWFVLPMLFSWISDAFQWKKKNQIVAMILGPWSYLPAAGRMIHNVIMAGVGIKRGQQLSPMQAIPEKMSRAASRLRKFFLDEPGPYGKDMTFENAEEVLKEITEDVGYIKGVPGPYAVQVYEATKKIVKGEKTKGAEGWRANPWWNLLFSEYALKAPEKGKVSRRILPNQNQEYPR